MSKGRLHHVKVAYFDCFSGAAGDMILAALIDAGVSADEFRDAMGRLPLDGYRISIEKVNKQGFAATRVEIATDESQKQPHRHLADIQKVIFAAALPDRVSKNAVAVFARLADVEAQAHGTTIDKVHFHEVGAVDAIIDIVGACWCLNRLGVERVVCSPLPVGSGMVRCEHGVLPVPAPATAMLLKGVPLAESVETGELTTPTGAAVLTVLADSFGPLPPLTIERIGVGAGSRDGKQVPNLLRVLLGEADGGVETDRVVVLEANVDDTTPEVLGYAVERLLDAGALDAYCLPIHMKKSRPAALLTVLAEVNRVEQLEGIIFEETTTFGIRRHEVSRTKLARSVEKVDTRYGEIRVKIGSYSGRVMTVSAEFDDCRSAAAKHGIALRVVASEAMHVWRKRQEES